MGQLFEVKDFDRKFYEKNLKDFLPAKIFDIHTHVWLEKFKAREKNAPVRSVSWPYLVAKDNSIEDLMETYKLMFPDKEVKSLIFSNLGLGDDFDAANEYVRKASKNHGFPALIFSDPRWSALEFEEKIEKGGFYGCKVYLNLSEPYIPEKEIRIFDFLPPHQLEVLDKRGWTVMLHIPRDGRLKDPVNLAQMLEIERKYQGLKLIIAHVGRAYCNEDVGDALKILSETKRMKFDFSANTNQWVFEQLIKAVGPKRILFGSDLPILRMRTKRVCENGNYVNQIPKGLYGDVSNDRHMRELEGEEAEKITFFLYEEIDAFRRAAKNCGLSSKDIEDIFYNNAIELLNLK